MPDDKPYKLRFNLTIETNDDDAEITLTLHPQYAPNEETRAVDDGSDAPSSDEVRGPMVHRIRSGDAVVLDA